MPSFLLSLWILISLSSTSIFLYFEIWFILLIAYNRIWICSLLSASSVARISLNLFFIISISLFWKKACNFYLKSKFMNFNRFYMYSISCGTVIATLNLEFEPEFWTGWYSVMIYMKILRKVWELGWALIALIMWFW